MKVPYIKVKQKGECFIITKFEAKYLKNHVNFHFRNPYNNQSSRNKMTSDQYIKLLEDKGLNVRSDPHGIQRRMNIAKINDITKTISIESEVMPNAILLCLDFQSVDNLYDYLDNFHNNFTEEFGLLDVPNDIMFKVVDGQHRLAGIFSCSEILLSKIEIPIILLLDCSNEFAAKIFSDINGKQSRVNTSLIIDLLGEQNPTEEDKILDKQLHNICRQLNEEKESPFYQHIKMLGYGLGSISQSFLVNCLKNVLFKSKKVCDELFFNNLFLYFSAIQGTYKKYWPVPFDSANYEDNNLTKYSSDIIAVNSQIMKTNGIGALLKILPFIFEKIDYYEKDAKKLFTSYLDIVEKIAYFDWVNDPLVKIGSGEKTQNLIAERLIEMIKRN